MPVLFYDVNKRLLASSIPTNTWSVSKPVCDLDYADDILFPSVAPPQMEQLRRHVQVEASLYGMQLNLTKKNKKILEGPSEQELIYFVDGTIVNQALSG